VYNHLITGKNYEVVVHQNKIGGNAFSSPPRLQKLLCRIFRKITFEYNKRNIFMFRILFEGL